MKTTIARLFTVLALALLPLTTQAREPVPIIDYEGNVVMVGSGKAPTASQVKNVIIAAAQSRGWIVAQAPSDDRVQATLHVRGKHTVVVDITYSAQAYSIKYQSSTNMKFGIARDTNVRVIHPSYNRWVSELHEAIRLELNRL